MSDLYEALKPLNERIEALEYSKAEMLKLTLRLVDLVGVLGNSFLKTN